LSRTSVCRLGPGSIVRERAPKAGNTARVSLWVLRTKRLKYVFVINALQGAPLPPTLFQIHSARTRANPREARPAVAARLAGDIGVDSSGRNYRSISGSGLAHLV
jgi:hypothetical protein